MLGGIEIGGTKIICGIGQIEGNRVSIADRVSFPTKSGKESLAEAISYFKSHKASAIGVACFGPLDLVRKSDTYGYVTSTPKEGWRDTNVLGLLSDAFSVPLGFDTDVNGACLGETVFGNGRGRQSVVYITVGTGIGAGVYINGSLLHGLVHPEAGHVIVRRHPEDTYEGACTVHRREDGCCLEGMASGPSLLARWGIRGEDIPKSSPAWDMEAWYLAQGISDFIFCYSPERIILGGGVMHQKTLLPKIRAYVKEFVNGYVRHPLLDGDLSDYIVPPLLGDDAGLAGALELARRAAQFRMDR